MAHNGILKGYITCPICLHNVYYDINNVVIKDNTYCVQCPTCMNDIQLRKLNQYGFQI